MKKRCLLRLAALLLAATMCVSVLPAALATFPDVEDDEWYTGYVNTLTQMGLLSGYTDGTFKPNGSLSRGEFVKLVDCCFGGTAARQGDRHWAAGHLDNLVTMGILLPGEMSDNKENLDEAITRYEMAVMLVRASDMRGDISFIPFDISLVLTDWFDIPLMYADYVMQAYSRGLLGGYPDGSFSGLNSLTRAEACAVIARLLFPYERLSVQIPGFEDVPLWLGQIGFIEVPPVEIFPEEPPFSELPPVQDEVPGLIPDGFPDEIPDFTPNEIPDIIPDVPSELPEPVIPPADMFAPVEGAVGFLSSEEQRMLLFGDSARSTFTSQTEADSFMQQVTVRVWSKGSDGVKRETQVELTVHRAVADDVKGIFELIFNGPQQYCIQTIGGYSWTSSLRSEHNAGTAIDLNPFANPYVNSSGDILVGDYYDPSDEYSLTADSDVVKAFAAYGWGWGGEGNWSSGALDYMHFSLRGT